jgi:hypothetical protein
LRPRGSGRAYWSGRTLRTRRSSSAGVPLVALLALHTLRPGQALRARLTFGALESGLALRTLGSSGADVPFRPCRPLWPRRTGRSGGSRRACRAGSAGWSSWALRADSTGIAFVSL